MKILIVDDDPQFVEILSYHLDQNNIQYDVASTVAQVQNYTARTPYDLILHDVFFPNKDDGLNSVKTLKSNLTTQETPIILMTSMPMEFFQQEPNLSHYLDMIDKFVSKEDDTSKIVDEIKNILPEEN
jgi:two-component system alkaline phosphatase synthesis response regulator PhoP